MKPDNLKQLLQEIRQKKITISKALEKIKNLPFEDIGFAKIDHHRELRCGFPEVVLCEGKEIHEVKDIAKRIIKQGSDLLLTRCDSLTYRAIKKIAPRAIYHKRARVITLKKTRAKKQGELRGRSNPMPFVLIITAGTSDIPVAEEAKVTAEMMNVGVKTLYDVGVAGIHRLLKNVSEIHKADVIIVVAGMEGALTSVVGGLVDKPIIGVPTSCGYGASFGGLSPLLTMLNSCAPNVCVVNIDNGFGAGYVASLITRVNIRCQNQKVS